MNKQCKRAPIGWRFLLGFASFSVLLASPFLANHAQANTPIFPPKLLHPDQQRSHTLFEQGLQQLKDEEYRKAIVSFNQAIQQDPKFQEAYSGRGFAFYRLGDLTQAHANYQQILQLDPTSASALSGLALIHTHLGNDEQAKVYAEKSAALQVKSITRQSYQGELSLLELGSATNGRSSNAGIWNLIQQGYQHLNAQRYREAVNTFSQATKLAPIGAPRPYIDRGVAYVWLRDYQAAIADFSSVIRANPFSVKAYEYRARAYQDIGQHQAAQADLQKAIQVSRQLGDQTLTQTLIAKLQQTRR